MTPMIHINNITWIPSSNHPKPKALPINYQDNLSSQSILYKFLINQDDTSLRGKKCETTITAVVSGVNFELLSIHPKTHTISTT